MDNLFERLHISVLDLDKGVDNLTPLVDTIQRQIEELREDPQRPTDLTEAWPVGNNSL